MRGESVPPVPHRGAITATIICACVMQGVDTTIANVALPHMQGSLSAAQDQISWVLTSYIVSAAIMMPLTGWLAARFGVKYLFLLGHRVHTRLGIVRRCDEPLPTRVLPYLARRVRGRAGAAGAGDAVYDLSARAPRLG